MTGQPPRTCAACGETFPSWAACERHSTAVGHRAFHVLPAYHSPIAPDRETHAMPDEILDKFRGRDIKGVRAKVTNTGDGLSKTLAVEPVILEHGDQVILTVLATVVKIATVPHTDNDLTGPLDYEYTWKAKAVALADTPQNRKLLDKMSARIDKAAQIPGQKSIDDEIDTDAEVVPLRPDDWGDDGNER